jgi:uncharacterized protein
MKNVLPHIHSALLALTISIPVLASAQNQPANLAPVAKATTSYVSPHETIDALNDGFTPRNSNDKSHGAYGNWQRTGTQWVQYEWPQPISTRQIDVYWFDDHNGVRLPKACRLLYWNGNGFVSVSNVAGLGLFENRFNTTTFDDVTTTRLRLEMDSQGTSSTGILEWRVYDNGKTANFAPTVDAGSDRVIILGAKVALNGSAHDDGKVNTTPQLTWSKASGPGVVEFAAASEPKTTATFSKEGDYVLKLSANDGQLTSSASVKVKVEPAPPKEHLDPVLTKTFKINSPLWTSRTKALIVNWIPHCYTKISDTNLAEGGIANFIQAANKLAGKPAARHKGPVFANAWVYNTIESICVALMLDPQGDPEIIAAQKAMRAKLEEWIPLVLSAQEPDGYLQTLYTLSGRQHWTNKGDHEGYTAGYFIEAAITHYILTDGKDTRLYDAAKKLADCWYRNLGPAPKKAWYDGHEEMEQALVRFARFIESVEGPGKGRQYVELAKFLLDSRKNGEDYDQSHLPVTEQLEAAGHAVRATYCYSAMTDIAMETGDLGYHSAVQSLWDNMVNKKSYLGGSLGSVAGSEGFGKNYVLPNNSYSESCANCGGIFFNYKLNLAYQNAKYADLLEETLYNAVLGDIDLAGENFTYTNPLDSNAARYKWHSCPCCVGNISRTLLMLPTWMYSKSADSLYVNLFIGSTVTIEKLAGTDVQMGQTTDYPWKGSVAITVNPAKPAKFALKIRVPNRNVSELYPATPKIQGLESLSVNGSKLTPQIENGYAIIERTWQAGDKVDLALPMEIQRVKALPQVSADAGRVALRYGPLVYNIESVDQDINQVLSNAPLTAQWNPGLLGGVVVLKGQFANGAPLTAIPNFARLNRGGRSIVWIKDQQ